MALTAPPRRCSPPAEPSSGSLDLRYEDGADGADGVTFEYDLHSSGALRVLRVFEDTPHRIEACVGPGAWLQVMGTYLRSGSEH
ncbi:hypothetical protein ACIGZJ_09970 [Kitasatospora sp. NPDC052868]|uniref:hypothetical protein n=1 Tax=Kitasatospora sp. NPDC052868 TaxID=3364060 RepID=UPI0037C7852D